jgi:hypothetical protein
MKIRELQAMATTRQVRASCNILAGIAFITSDRNCVLPREVVALGFAQSVLKNVGKHDVIGAL